MVLRIMVSNRHAAPISHSENGSIIFLRNVGTHVAHSTTLYALHVQML
jgi:hypothetical protein